MVGANEISLIIIAFSDISLIISIYLASLKKYRLTHETPTG